MSPQQQRGQKTAQRLLKTALALYRKRGIGGVTVEALSAKSGVSIGSIYHHYGSIDGLRAALYQKCMLSLLHFVLKRLQRCRSARGGVKAVVVAYLVWTQENRDQAGYIHGAYRETFTATHHNEIAAFKAEPIENIAAWFQPWIDAGELVVIPPALYEMVLIGPVAETARRWLADYPGIDLEQAIAALPERIWQALRRPTAKSR